MALFQRREEGRGEKKKERRRKEEGRRKKEGKKKEVMKIKLCKLLFRIFDRKRLTTAS